jgi:hypothetical protein
MERGCGMGAGCRSPEAERAKPSTRSSGSRRVSSNIIPAWSGADLGPLPCESSFSVLARFSWANALDAKSARTIAVREATQVSKAGDLPPIPWVLPSSSDVWLPGLFTRERLGMCPICMSELYHSYWFDFEPLTHCPIHGCEIVTRCQSCGGDLPLRKELGRKLSRPYACRSCGCPITGEAVSLEAHLARREDMLGFENAFEELEHWRRAYLANGPSIRHAVPIDACAARRVPIGKMRALALAACHRWLPLPAGCNVPLPCGTRVMIYRISLKPREVPHRGYSHGQEHHHARVLSAYRAFRRRMEREYAQRGIEQVSVDLWSGAGDPCVVGKPAEALALSLLRYCCEPCASWDAPPEGAMLRAVPAPAWPKRPNPLPLSAWRFVYWLLMATAYSLITESRGHGRLAREKCNLASLGAWTVHPLAEGRDEGTYAAAIPFASGCPFDDRYSRYQEELCEKHFQMAR